MGVPHQMYPRPPHTHTTIHNKTYTNMHTWFRIRVLWECCIGCIKFLHTHAHAKTHTQTRTHSVGHESNGSTAPDGTNISPSPTGNAGTPAFQEKSPIFPQQKPCIPANSHVFLQKSPTFLQKSLTFPQKSPAFLQKSPNAANEPCVSALPPGSA